MKFRKGKEIIESSIKESGRILISMESSLFYSLLKRGEREKGDGRNWEILQESFIPIWNHSIYGKDDEEGGNEDYLLITNKGWRTYLSLI